MHPSREKLTLKVRELFSHYQNLEKIEAKKDPNSTMIEASVDIFLLRYTFSDGDKIIFLDKSMAGLSKHIRELLSIQIL